MQATEELFRHDSYVKSCQAQVLGVNERGGIILDRTVFYATGGGQPGDSGTLCLPDGSEIEIATTVHDRDSRAIVHVPAEPAALTPGQDVTCALNWDRRHQHMRVHSCLHLLCALLPYLVTGGSISEGQGRLDFDIPDAGLDKAALSEELNALIARDAPVTMRWITDEELDAQPELVRTMAVQPPRGSGRVRLIEIGDIDLQPCGGTHVATTAEIGTAEVTKIEKKGAQNRRVRIALLENRSPAL
ncbi:MAG: alanyl-tRNA editing protein [Hyphomicrobiales bacterium]|nr:alanyl-tRNA editing protein [Hyphomicrobiales bacterium]